MASSAVGGTTKALIALETKQCFKSHRYEFVLGMYDGWFLSLSTPSFVVEKVATYVHAGLRVFSFLSPLSLGSS